MLASLLLVCRQQRELPVLIPNCPASLDVLANVLCRWQRLEVFDPIVQPISVSMVDVMPRRNFDTCVVEHPSMLEHEAITRCERMVWREDAPVTTPSPRIIQPPLPARATSRAKALGCFRDEATPAMGAGLGCAAECLSVALPASPGLGVALVRPPAVNTSTHRQLPLL